MPEEFMIDEDQQIMRIVAVGKVTPEDQKGMLGLVEETVNEHGLSRLLVDGTKATSFPDTLSLYSHGEAHVDSVGALKTAVVILPSLVSNLGFLEDVIFNRGGKMRLFDSKEAAIEWLQGS